MRAAIKERESRSRYEQFGLRDAAIAPLRSPARGAARLLSETSESIEAQLLKLGGAHTNDDVITVLRCPGA